MYRFKFLNAYYHALFNTEPNNLNQGIDYINQLQKRQNYFISFTMFFMEYLYPFLNLNFKKFSSLKKEKQIQLINLAENSNFLFLRQFTSKTKMILSILYFSESSNQKRINYYARDN